MSAQPFVVYCIVARCTVPRHIVGDFEYWLRTYVYEQRPDTTSPCYGRKTNPLVVTSKEVTFLKRATMIMACPYFFAKAREVSGENGERYRSILEKAAVEHHQSFGFDEEVIGVRQLDISDTELAEEAFKRLGGLSFLVNSMDISPETKIWAQVLAGRCQDQEVRELIYLLALSNVHNAREKDVYSRYVPSMD